VTVAASVVPPKHAEEQTVRGDTDDFRVERTKNEDQDAMDVEQTSAYPPVEEPTANKRSNEPATTERKDAEGDPHIH
jgi:hypothetical protein